MQDPSLDVVLLLVAGMVATANLFLYCFFGAMATESYEQMAECLYKSKWYGRPTHLQKYFIIMIGNMQRPLYYHGFGLAILNLQTYSTVNSFDFLMKICFLIFVSFYSVYSQNLHFLYDVQNIYIRWIIYVSFQLARILHRVFIRLVFQYHRDISNGNRTEWRLNLIWTGLKFYHC